MNLLLLGKNGQLGWELQRCLQPLGRVAAFDTPKVDLADAAGLRKIVRECHPDCIVNAAAYTAVDKANVAMWKSERQKDLQLQGTSMLVGEFGLSPDNDDFDQYLTDALTLFDDFQSHWTYWCNGNNGNDRSYRYNRR